MNFKTPYKFETVRPAKICSACKYLVTSPVNVNEGVTLSDSWKHLHVPVPFNESPALDSDDTIALESIESMDIDRSDSEDKNCFEIIISFIQLSMNSNRKVVYNRSEKIDFKL